MYSYPVPSTLATSEDYAAWTQTTSPTNIDQILRSCSSLVLDESRYGVYDFDTTTGLATDDAVKGALRDATCIQAAAWVALGINPALGGVQTQSVRKSKKLGSAVIDYADSEAAAASRASALTRLVPEARQKLRQYNLIGNSANG